MDLFLFQSLSLYNICIIISSNINSIIIIIIIVWIYLREE